MKLSTIALIGCLTLGAMALTGFAESQPLDCRGYTYEATQAERQRLYQQGQHSQAELLVRMVEACEVQQAGGLKAQHTMSLHYKLDVEHRSLGARYDN